MEQQDRIMDGDLQTLGLQSILKMLEMISSSDPIIEVRSVTPKNKAGSTKPRSPRNECGQFRNSSPRNQIEMSVVEK